jgi:hypothetical protein
MVARGVRNNNPGNIRYGKSIWRGQVAKQTDPSFLQFVSMDYGVRALALTLINYQRLYHLDTVRKIISRWAPPNENNTDAYIGSVASRAKVSPDTRIDLLHDRSVLEAIVTGIIMQENGKYGLWVSPHDIDVGVDMARGVYHAATDAQA